MAATGNAAVLELHPLCTLFPRLAGAEFEALKADIIANGQREPITVHEGLVLDGGNRYRACIEAGIEPETKPFTGADPVSFVLSANLHRRHLTPGQQAAIVASAQDWTRAQGPGGDRRSEQAATLPLDSVADRAAQSGASERTQRMADKVARQSPELAKQVAHGEITLPKALEQLAPKPANPAPRAPAPADAGDSLDDGPDPLYDQAVAIVVEHRRASISLVQRHLLLGYNRAARLIEAMERAGVVSPPAANGDRIVVAPAPLASAGAARPAPAHHVQEQPAPAAAQEDDDEAAVDADPADGLAIGDDDGHQQLLDDYNAVVTERDELAAKVAALEAHIELLSRADLNAEVATTLVKRAADAEYKFEQLSGRNRQLQQTARDAQMTAQYQADLLAKVRNALTAESNADILPAIMARRAA